MIIFNIIISSLGEVKAISNKNCYKTKTSIGSIVLCYLDKNFIQFENKDIYEKIELKDKSFLLKGNGALNNHYLTIIRANFGDNEEAIFKDIQISDENRKVLSIDKLVKLTNNDKNALMKINLTNLEDILQIYGLYNHFYPENIDKLIINAGKYSHIKYFKDYLNENDLKNTSIDYSTFSKTVDKSIYKDFIVYSFDNCEKDKGCKKYNLFGTDKDGNLIKDGQKLFVLEGNVN